MGAPNSRANSDIPFHLDLYMRHNSKNNQIPPIRLTSEKGMNIYQSDQFLRKLFN